MPAPSCVSSSASDDPAADAEEPRVAPGRPRRSVASARAQALGGQLRATRSRPKSADRSACRPRRPCRGLAEARRRRLRRRGCRRRSETPGRARRPQRSIAVDACVVGARHDRAGDRRRADQRAGLPRVHARAAPSASSVGRRAAGAWPCRLQVDRLAADHAGRARGVARRRAIDAQLAADDRRIVGGAARGRAARTPRHAARRRRGWPCLRRTTTCSVGRPRRSVSLSIAGRSSWMSE